MVSPNYQVKRENIFVGKVGKITSPEQIILESGKLKIYQFIPYRSILFSLNENKQADDLLYQSPNYPALNLSSNEDCLNSKILIQEGYNLEALLTFFHFPDILTLSEITALRKHFFEGTWGFRNCHLFGYQEILPEDWTYVENGAYVKDEEDLKRLQRKERALQKRGHRVFQKLDNSLLPPEMMFLFHELGDHSILDVLQGFEKCRNAFKPHEEEGKIKKLSLKKEEN